MTIQSNVPASATLDVRDPVSEIFLNHHDEHGAKSPEFVRLLPPASELAARAVIQSESHLGENVPVFNERLTQARPTRWYGIND